MSNQDIIFINNLTILTTIGVYDWEKSIKQKVILDLELYTDTSIPASNDDIDKTIDYKALTDNLCEFIANSNFDLIETLAERISEYVLEDSKISKLSLVLKKPKAILNADTVGIKIVRERS